MNKHKLNGSIIAMLILCFCAVTIFQIHGMAQNITPPQCFQTGGCPSTTSPVAWYNTPGYAFLCVVTALAQAFGF